MEQIVVRAPVPADGPQIGRLHVRAWKRAYAGLMPEVFLDELNEADWGRAWGHRLAARSRGQLDEGNVLLVAERAIRYPVGRREVVGVATLGADRDDPDRRQGELWMINVHPDVWGSGVGHRLLLAAHDRLADQGFASAVLWVVAGNTRARRFYERHGWVDDGTSKQSTIGGAPLAECRYRRRLHRPGH